MSPGRRRALLIAVPGYPYLQRVPELREVYDSLPFTVTDVANLRDTLVRSGYAPEDVTVLDDEDATIQQNITQQLDEFLRSCRDGDVGLVYFSGHGVRLGEADFLVPSDIWARQRPDGEWALKRQRLIEVELDDLLQRLTSDATVLLCLDACRSDGSEADGLAKLTVSRPRDNVVVLRACAPGERTAGHIQDGSFMARALVEAVKRDSAARTVGQVIESVADSAPEIARRYSYLKPPEIDVRWLGNDPSGGVRADVVLCEAMPFADTWTEAVRSSALWGLTEGTDAAHGMAKEQLGEVVAKVLAIRRKRGAKSDPWDDDLFPERLIKRLETLVVASGARLGLVETVVLLGTPFLREAALACGLAALRSVLKEGTEAATTARDQAADSSFQVQLARDMGDVRRAHRQVESWRETLVRRGRAEDAHGAEYWLRHRFLADWDLLWESEDASLDSLRSAVDLLVRATAGATGEPLHDGERDVLRRAVLQVVSQLGTGTPPEAVAPDGTEWDSELGRYLWGKERWSWRPRELATLLYVAGLLAIDARMLDGVVIDHLGPREPTQIRPPGIVSEIRANTGFDLSSDTESLEATASVEVSGTRWVLIFKCGSAAMYTALDRLAARVAAVSQAARRTHAPLRPRDLLCGLPKAVKTDGLQPKNRAFDRPPPRFQLAEDEVKPLIMGTQLYGDRMLAVRELYQNALDACRVRQARRRYADRLRRGVAEPPEWAQTDCYERDRLAGSRIVFTQGTDETGERTYIQCEDNGVGMTAEELRDLFAQAGRRSEQSSARMREMRRWRRQGITTELNSRFGIGVFSYFMLAEEIEVITRPVGMPGHRASVTAGSGLMHLRREDNELEGGGTIVRLYLHDEPEGKDEQRPSLLQALREFLWCSPVKVTASEFDGDPVVWQPGQLYGDSSLPSRCFEAAEDVWWVDGPGMLLVDGLFVSKADRPHGYVVNLRGRHGPKLSVDRNRILAYEEPAVKADLQAAVPALIGSGWRPFPLEWLWKFLEDRPELGLTVLDELTRSDVPLFISRPGRQMERVRVQGDFTLGRVGCLPLDRLLVNGVAAEPGHDVRFFLSWRRQVLGLVRDRDRRCPATAFPRPQPLDAILLRGIPHGSWFSALRAAAETGLSLREVTRQLRRYAIVGVPVPERADIRGLSDFAPDALMTDLYRAAHSELSEDTAPGECHPLAQALVCVSAERRESLGTLADLCEQLSRLDRSIPHPPDLGDLRSHVVNARERRVLVNDDGSGPTGAFPGGDLPFTGAVSPVAVAYRAQQTGIPAAEIEAVVDHFQPLGYRLTGPPLTGSIDEVQFAALSRDLNGQSPFLEPGVVPPLHLVRLAALREEAVGDTASWLTGWASALGFDVDPGALASLRPPRWCKDLEGATTTGTGARGGVETGPVTVWGVLQALGELEPSSIQWHIAAVEALAKAGLADPEAVQAAGNWLKTPRNFRPVEITKRYWGLSGRRSGNFASFGAPPVANRTRIDSAYLLGLAAETGSSIGDVADRLRRSGIASYGLEVADVPEDAVGLRPDLSIYRALISDQGEWREHMSLLDAFEFAYGDNIDVVTAVADVHAYRSLGAPAVPVPPGFEPSAAWDKRDPEVELALAQHDLVDSWNLTPLALVVTAGRLGLTLPQTYRRLLKFAEVGLGIRFPEPAVTRIPDWRDVVILTARLTGREPVLSGDVTEDHLALASEETDLTVEEVRERLWDYAPLFDYRLPPPCEGN